LTTKRGEQKRGQRRKIAHGGGDKRLAAAYRRWRRVALSAASYAIELDESGRNRKYRWRGEKQQAAATFMAPSSRSAARHRGNGGSGALCALALPRCRRISTRLFLRALCARSRAPSWRCVSAGATRARGSGVMLKSNNRGGNENREKQWRRGIEVKV